MPGGGNSCVIPECHTHGGGQKYKGVSLFQIPTRKCDAEWTNMLIAAIARYRTMDTQLRDLIRRGKCFICEKHFRPADIELTKTGKKTMALYALPVLNLPQKSHETPRADTSHC